MQTIDKFGDHATCCTRTGDLIVRHNSLRNLVNKISTEGMLSPEMEKKESSGLPQTADLEMSPSPSGTTGRVLLSTLR
jgi:hypothetical protein